MTAAETIASALARLLGVPERLDGFEERLGRIERALMSPAAAPTTPADDQLLTVEEAAAVAKVTPATVRSWIMSGRLTASKPAGSRRWRVRHDRLLAYLRDAAPDDLDLTREAARLLRSSGGSR